MILGFLIGFLADHTLIVIVADKFDDAGWVDRVASLVGVGSNRAETHFITRGKRCDKDISVLLIGDALAHRRKLLAIISELCEVGTYIIILPAARTLQLPPQVNW